MADNIWLSADEEGKKLREQREAEKQMQKRQEAAKAETENGEKQHEENKRQGMI